MANEKPVDPALVRELAEILRENDLSGIEVEADEVHIKLSRTSGAVAAQQTMPAPAPLPVAAPTSAPPPSSPSSTTSVAAPSNGTTVPSPMVGTAYLSSTPGGRPFVSEGQVVNEGDTLLIIEAMKVMNQIPAPRAGKITSIMCENGQPVEYDQPLMVIE